MITLVPTGELQLIEANWTVACAVGLAEEVRLLPSSTPGFPHRLWWEYRNCVWDPCGLNWQSQPIIEQARIHSEQLQCGEWAAITGRGAAQVHSDRMQACMLAFIEERFGEFVVVAQELLEIQLRPVHRTETYHFYRRHYR